VTNKDIEYEPPGNALEQETKLKIQNNEICIDLSRDFDYAPGRLHRVHVSRGKILNCFSAYCSDNGDSNN